MARPLRLAIYPEGPTDVRFLGPVLRRLTASFRFARGVDIPEQVPDIRVADSEAPTRAARIREAVERADGVFDVLFVHADGAGDPVRARAEQIDPGIGEVGSWLPVRQAVGVVPVREMEAWALADGDALRQVLGSIRSDEALGVPSPSTCEQVTDPKQRLDAIVAAAHARGRRRGAHYLAALGDAVRLEQLARIRSFRALRDELEVALTALGYLRS